VILAGFAGAADILIDRQVSNQFVAKMNEKNALVPKEVNAEEAQFGCNWPNMFDFAAGDDAEIRLFSPSGRLLCSQNTDPKTLAPLNRPAFTAPTRPATYDQLGYRVMVQDISWKNGKRVDHGRLLYAQPRSATSGLTSEIRLSLILGVLGGTLLAMVAGLYVARRAMRPITELTDAAREIERTRDPSLRIPHP
jgi:hypothetical protein